MSTYVEYAVLCRRDGEVRDISTPDPAKAAAWAASRDEECGTCYAEHNPHVVVSRTLTLWQPAVCACHNQRDCAEPAGCSKNCAHLTSCDVGEDR